MMRMDASAIMLPTARTKISGDPTMPKFEKSSEGRHMHFMAGGGRTACSHISSVTSSRVSKPGVCERNGTAVLEQETRGDWGPLTSKIVYNGHIEKEGCRKVDPSQAQLNVDC